MLLFYLAAQELSSNYLSTEHSILGYLKTTCCKMKVVIGLYNKISKRPNNNIYFITCGLLHRNDDILLKSLLTHDALPDLAKISDTDFVYGICRGKMRCYNPYDLKIVQYSDIPSDSIFYTINSENIMMVC